MKVCIPIEDGEGLTARVSGHFGAASAYLIHDTGTNETKLVKGTEGEHEHGGCRPLDNLEVGTLDAMIVGGIGPRAVGRLGEAGVKVYQAAAPTAGENIEALGKGELHELTTDEACTHGEHGCAE